MFNLLRSCSNRSVAIAGSENDWLIRTVGTCLNITTRSWSIDCVLISRVFWRSWTPGVLFLQWSQENIPSFGGGYVPTPKLTTRILSGGIAIEMVASAIA